MYPAERFLFGGRAGRHSATNYRDAANPVLVARIVGEEDTAVAGAGSPAQFAERCDLIQRQVQGGHRQVGTKRSASGYGKRIRTLPADLWRFHKRGNAARSLVLLSPSIQAFLLVPACVFHSS